MAQKHFTKQELLMSKYLNQFPIYWLIRFYYNNHNIVATIRLASKRTNSFNWPASSSQPTVMPSTTMSAMMMMGKVVVTLATTIYWTTLCIVLCISHSSTSFTSINWLLMLLVLLFCSVQFFLHTTYIFWNQLCAVVIINVFMSWSVCDKQREWWVTDK